MQSFYDLSGLSKMFLKTLTILAIYKVYEYNVDFL
jgi:hypothetical protein